MTDDDGFVFGDEEETTLFGRRSSDESNTETTTDRRFGTTTDSRSFGRRVRAVVSGGTVRTAATVVLAVALVVAVGLVAYPHVMGTLDGSDSGTEPTTDAVEFVDSTERSPTAWATPETATIGTTAVTANETTVPTTTRTPSPSPTPTERTTTPLTREFPAGEPVDDNETDT